MNRLNTNFCEINKKLKDLYENKLDKLISGQNIKTINYQSILGEGNLDIKGGTSSSQLLGYVNQNTEHLPITRRDGTPAEKEDYVKPESNATFPFTIDGVTFNTRLDRAIYLGDGRWMIDVGVILQTNETPVSNDNLESLTGSATFLSDVNEQFANTIGKNKTIVVDNEETLIDAVNYIWDEVSKLGGKVLKFKGFISNTTPTGTITNGSLWYQGTELPTTFPINVKTYNAETSQWSSTTSTYNPTTFDLWANLNNNNGYYWFGNEWNLIDENVLVDNKTIHKNLEKELELKDGNNIDGVTFLKLNYNLYTEEVVDNDESLPLNSAVYKELLDNTNSKFEYDDSDTEKDLLTITLKNNNRDIILEKEIDFDDKLVFEKKEQTLENKTIDADDNEILNLTGENVKDDFMMHDIKASDYHYGFTHGEDNVFTNTTQDGLVNVYSISDDKVITLLGEGTLAGTTLTYDSVAYTRNDILDDYYIDQSDIKFSSVDMAIFLKKLIDGQKVSFKKVSTFSGELGDLNTLYYLTTSYDNYKKGFYLYNGTVFYQIDYKSVKYVSTFNGIEGDNEALYYLDTDYNTYVKGFYRYVETTTEGVTTGEFVLIGHNQVVYLSTFDGVTGNTEKLYYLDTVYENYNIGFYRFIEAQGTTPAKFVQINIAELSESIFYSELKTLRDSEELVPGKWYRITDYVTTTAQADTQSAGHQFDVIVQAQDINVLSETAYATQHDGDTYFANSELSAWELKYCLDNDTNRFSWADASGKGVIFSMKDEFNNECPYDFKNIQFKRYKITQCRKVSTLVGTYLGTDGIDAYTIDRDNFIWCFTFSSSSAGGEQTDQSMSKTNNVHTNIIGVWFSTAQKLNNIVFFGSSYYSNTFDTSCYNNTFGNSCYSNTFGTYCQSNTFGAECRYNTFGNYCQYNTFGLSCKGNTFDQSCFYNTFGDYFLANYIDSGVQYCLIVASPRTTENRLLRNTRVYTGVKGTASEQLTITFASDKDYLQVAGMTSAGQLRIWNPADIAGSDATIIDVDILPTEDIDTDAIYRLTTVHYYHNDTELAAEPQGYKSLDAEAVVIDGNGITVTSSSTVTPWAEVTDAFLQTLIDGSLVSTCDYSEASFFKLDTDSYDFGGNFTTGDTYTLWHNATGDPTDWNEISSVANLVTDGKTTEEVNGELQANAIIDVDELPTTNIKENSIYRKTRYVFYNANGEEAVPVEFYVATSNVAREGLYDEALVTDYIPWSEVTDVAMDTWADGTTYNDVIVIWDSVDFYDPHYSKLPSSTFVKFGPDEYYHIYDLKIVKELFYRDNGAWRQIGNEGDLERMEQEINNLKVSKQDTLESGTNIKTIANQSLLGNGDVEFKTINNSSISGSGNLNTGKVTSDYQTNSVSIYEGADNSVQISKDGNDAIRIQGYGKDDRGATQTFYDMSLANKNYVDTEVAKKQDTLVSGTNIKTVNGNSLLGSGDVEITGGAKVQVNSTGEFGQTRDGDNLLSFSDNGTNVDMQMSKGSTANNLTLATKDYVDGRTGINFAVGQETWYGTYTDENDVVYQVYTKTVYIPALPSTAGVTTYPHDVANIKQILSIYGFTTDGFVLNAPRQNIEDNITIYQASKSASNQTFSIEVGKDRSSKKAYVTMVYAKNN